VERVNLPPSVVQSGRTQTGLTGTSFTYTVAQYLADAPAGKAVQFRITPINASLQGTVRATDAFYFGGFGLAFGRNFGGMNELHALNPRAYRGTGMASGGAVPSQSDQEPRPEDCSGQAVEGEPRSTWPGSVRGL